MPSERSERLYLADIRDAIDRILAYTSEGREAFLCDTRTQDAVVRNIEIIGDLDVVWDVVANDLRPLRERMEQLPPDH
jgi:uncharacterized protein with HEPN domain